MKSREANFSRNVEQASDAVKSARDNLLEELRVAYPIDSLVRVVHHRGEYEGFVTGHDVHGERVIIKNWTTNRISGRWFREVEMA